MELQEASTTAMSNLAETAGSQLAAEFSSGGGAGILDKVVAKHSDHATIARNCAILKAIFEK